MEAIPSPLKIKDFSVFECEMKFISPEDNETEILLGDLPIEIDYDYYAPKDDDQATRMIEMVLKVNSDKKPGYYINLTVAGIFEIEDAENLDEELVVNLFGISALNMMISQTRAFLISVTTYGPFGNYLLPAIDIGDLRKRKSAE